MNARSIFVTGFLLAAACGEPQTPTQDAATLKMNVIAEGVDLRPYAANETEAILNLVRPVSIQFLICDNIEIVAGGHFCALEAENYNFEQRVNVSGDSGTLEITGIPAARDQVITAQGIAADDKITYQGFVTLPVIQPRGVYSVDVNLKQIAYPPLPAPQPPELIKPASSPFTVASDQNTYVFEGTREPETYIKITPPDLLGIGNFVEYSESKPPRYEEAEFADRIEWKFTVDTSRLRQSFDRNYVFSFEAARDGEDKFSEKTTVTMTVCATTGGC